VDTDRDEQLRKYKIGCQLRNITWWCQ